MPAHGSASSIGRAPDSNGNLVTAVMWRANRLVDLLAKAAAGEFQLKPFVLSQLAAAPLLVRHQAAVLGLLSHGKMLWIR